jgi:hypothetical protein
MAFIAIFYLIQVKIDLYQLRTTGIPNHPEEIQTEFRVLHRYPDLHQPDHIHNRMHHKHIFA